VDCRRGRTMPTALSLIIGPVRCLLNRVVPSLRMSSMEEVLRGRPVGAAVHFPFHRDVGAAPLEVQPLPSSSGLRTHTSLQTYSWAPSTRGARYRWIPMDFAVPIERTLTHGSVLALLAELGWGTPHGTADPVSLLRTTGLCPEGGGPIAHGLQGLKRWVSRARYPVAAWARTPSKAQGVILARDRPG